MKPWLRNLGLGTGSLLWILVVVRINAALAVPVMLPDAVADTLDRIEELDSVAPMEEMPVAPSTVSSPVPPAACCNVNRADLLQLQQLPGIGPVLAQAIIDHRHRNGDYALAEDLLKVKGIGTSRLTKIRNQICF